MIRSGDIGRVETCSAKSDRVPKRIEGGFAGKYREIPTVLIPGGGDGGGHLGIDMAIEIDQYIKYFKVY